MDKVREALAWYGEQARLSRLIHSEGDAGRHALAADGGDRAREALSVQPAPSEPAAEPDDSLVICPECCSQFRAIPVQVQGLLLDAGYAPPFEVSARQNCWPAAPQPPAKGAK